MIHLQKASLQPPEGLVDMLHELRDGEAGFSGTAFARGEITLADFLQQCCDGEDESKIAANLVPQTVFWMIDENGRVVGMVRMRHRLNDHLLQGGGHVGYYVRPAERGKGYASATLDMAVKELNCRGVDRVLVTVHPENTASMRVAEKNGGQLDTPGKTDQGKTVNRYWISSTRPHQSLASAAPST